MPTTAPRRLVAGLSLLLLVATAATAAADPGQDNGKKKGHDKNAKQSTPAADFCSGGGPARPLDVTVDGFHTSGLYAVPKGKATGLVVYTHGYGHTAESWRKHLTDTAARDGVIAVAMNYHGETIIAAKPGEPRPSSRGWRVREGAADANAAAQLIERRCHGLKTIVLYGVSMGGNTAGLALAARPTRTGGAPLYDYWFQMEGVSNVLETYLSARALQASGNATAVNAVEDIEQEMGGTFEEKSDVYLDHVVVNRMADIAQSGIKGAILMHGVADGLVPYNQGRELWTRLLEAGITTEFHTFATRGDASEPGTTIDGYVPNPTGLYTSPFAGHASEASDTHIQNITGFRRLSDLLSRERGPRCAEYLVDGTTSDTVIAEAC